MSLEARRMRESYDVAWCHNGEGKDSTPQGGRGKDVVMREMSYEERAKVMGRGH